MRRKWLHRRLLNLFWKGKAEFGRIQAVSVLRVISAVCQKHLCLANDFTTNGDEEEEAAV
jgi:hypothetical protein